MDINAHFRCSMLNPLKIKSSPPLKNTMANPDFHGIIVQLPLPDYDMADEVIAAIDPEKDADGFHPETLKKLREGKRETLPVMSRVILYILDHEKYNLRGRKVLIAAHNPYFIEGQKILLEERGGTVSSCEPTDPRLGDFTRQADVLIAAGRSPALISNLANGSHGVEEESASGSFAHSRLLSRDREIREGKPKTAPATRPR